MTRPFFPVAIALLALAACGRDAPPLDQALEGRAKAAIAAEFVAPRVPGAFTGLWLADAGAADGLVCGRMAAPDGVDLRFVYEDRSRHGQLEWRDVLATTRAMAELVQQNRRTFDQIWARNCAPAEPSASLFAGLFS